MVDTTSDEHVKKATYQEAIPLHDSRPTGDTMMAVTALHLRTVVSTMTHGLLSLYFAPRVPGRQSELTRLSER